MPLYFNGVEVGSGAVDITYSTSADGNTQTIVTGETFVFDQYRMFRAAYQNFVVPNGELRIDMAVTSYLDSAGLGMLMVLMEHAKLYQQRVVLVEVRPTVRHILDIASFGKILTIE